MAPEASKHSTQPDWTLETQPKAPLLPKKTKMSAISNSCKTVSTCSKMAKEQINIQEKDHSAKVLRMRTNNSWTRTPSKSCKSPKGSSENQCRIRKKECSDWNQARSKCGNTEMNLKRLKTKRNSLKLKSNSYWTSRTRSRSSGKGDTMKWLIRMMRSLPTWWRPTNATWDKYRRTRSLPGRFRSFRRNTETLSKSTKTWSRGWRTLRDKSKSRRLNLSKSHRGSTIWAHKGLIEANFLKIRSLRKNNYKRSNRPLIKANWCSMVRTWADKLGSERSKSCFLIQKELHRIWAYLWFAITKSWEAKQIEWRWCKHWRCPLRMRTSSLPLMQMYTGHYWTSSSRPSALKRSSLKENLSSNHMKENNRMN